MRRITGHAVVAVIVGGLLSPVASMATATPAAADTYGAESTVAGGGRGMSGPASRALLSGNSMRIDAAPDGSVLAADDLQVLRVQPDSDTVTVVPGTTVTNADQPISDAAAAGSAVIFANATGVHRAAADATTTLLYARNGVRAVDVGSDGVVWVATSHDVLRILADGTVVPVTTPTSGFGSALDLAVTPDGSTAYVLDDGVGRYGVYQVTAAGIGARVAGDLARDDGLRDGMPATGASTEAVRSLTTDGTTIALASPEYQRVVRFAVGGVLHQVWSGACSQGITTRGSELVAFCFSTFNPSPPSLHRFSTAGADLGRIFGLDPAAPWSPDGVRATDAHLDTLRGAAALPDGRVVFTTEHGLVREVGTDGRLHTRATLAPIVRRGKVAVGSDGTAYVVTDAGGVTEVPVSGPAVPVTVDADATDVEVEAGGDVIVADARGHRLLRVPADGGAVTVLTDGLAAPSDIGIDGDTVLVADTGLRRVSADGAISTLSSGGSPRFAAASPAGVWTSGRDDSSWPYVLLPGGGLVPVRSDDGLRAQVQAVGDGDVLIAGGSTVRLVTDPGLPGAGPDLTVTATAGEGRILLGWDGRTTNNTAVIAKPGAVPPADFWDGVPVGTLSAADGQHAVLRVGEHLLQAGEQWSFAVFAMVYAPFGDQGAIETWSAGAPATATVLPDTTPPPVVTPDLTVTQTSLGISWFAREGDDLDHTVLRMALGTTPPATPDDGTELGRGAPSTLSGAQVPGPVPDQDYALSLFAVDLHGNFSRWSDVLRLDLTPPAAVTDLQVAPAYRWANVSFTRPADPDYGYVAYAVAPGNDTPSRSNASTTTGSSITAWGLSMGTDYTLAVWSIDKNGNVSEPAVTHFATLLDTQPPGPATDLSATGGDYQVTASWVPPTDSDLDKLTARLTDTTTGTVTAVSLAKTATSYTWARLPGGRSYTVSVVATDVNGLTSEVADAAAGTAPDSNGTPAPVDPSTVTVTPRSSSSVTVAFPKPAIPDLKAVGYATVPLGQDPASYTAVHMLVVNPGVTNVIGTVALPQPMTGFQLVLLVWDYNGNLAQSVVPRVEGVPNASELPVAPVVSVRSPADNALTVSWTGYVGPGTRATTWTVVASSGSLTRTAIVPGGTSIVGALVTYPAHFADLPGRQDWTVTVTGTNSLGAGPTVTAAAVTVADDTGPAPVTAATRTPVGDAEVLTWADPTAFDFDHVVVTRLGTTAAETQVIYSGSGTSARATGLLPGRAYSFEIRAFDHLGNVAADPVTLSTIQPALTLIGPAALGYGKSATLTGSLAWNGTHPRGLAVIVQAQPYGSTAWTQVAAANTSATGAFSAAVRPSVNTRYRAVYMGSGAIGGAASPVRPLAVAPALSILANRSSLRLGGTVTISTTFAPRHAGGSVVLQRWTGARWATAAIRTLSSVSTASASVLPPSRGTNTYRWVSPADSAHAAGYSPSMQVRVY